MHSGKHAQLQDICCGEYRTPNQTWNTPVKPNLSP